MNTLIVSPPKCGKTTVLRDIVRNLSGSGFKVGVCDERCEIAGSSGGSADSIWAPGQMCWIPAPRMRESSC